MTRRNVLKYGTFAAFSLSSTGHMLLSDSAFAQSLSDRKVLTLYFSRTGTTENLAKQIHSIVGGDIACLNPANAYPSDYNTTVDQAQREQNTGARPAFQRPSVDISNYDVIFLGYPLWWGSIPMFYATFLETNALSGKTAAPFCTYGSSGLSLSVTDIRRFSPRTTVLDGYGISGTKSDATARREIFDWLGRINLA